MSHPGKDGHPAREMKLSRRVSELELRVQRAEAMNRRLDNHTESLVELRERLRVVEALLEGKGRR